MSVSQYRAAQGRARRNKYGNRKVVVGDEVFDSEAEYLRCLVLRDMERCGEISHLKRQVRYELIPRQQAKSGAKYRETSYVADFTYYKRGGDLVVEDVKGALTREYKLKKKLMLWRHGIEILETR